MLTLEISGEFITWPADFAITMLEHYVKHGISVTIHFNCIHTKSVSLNEESMLSGSRIFLEVRGDYEFCHL